MARRTASAALFGALLLGFFCSGATFAAEESRFAMTHSRSQYVHWIDLYDAADQRIDPTDPNAAPYSPTYTCGRCHDYEAIAHGYHFNALAKLQDAGRPGEPWIWTDTRSGTQLPLSYRGWPGTYDPGDLGISTWDFVLKFGRQLPGGGPGEVRGVAPPPGEVSARDEEEAKEEAADEGGGPRASAADPQEPAEEAETSITTAAPADNGRWKLSGLLAVDCMMCHGKERTFSPEVWWDQIEKQNFAWASAVALGMADIQGEVVRLPADFDPSATSEEGEGEGEEPAAAKQGPTLPKITYRPLRMNSDKKVFFEISRKPSNDACYYCHTTRVAGAGEVPAWTHDEDVHLRAGMSCSDCHRNGIDHHTVRGYEGESHPSGANVATLSCRGCHLGEDQEAAGGRLGAPKPLHRGLPPIHLERLSCTSCHSGPKPGPQALHVQTAMAHGLGLPTHSLEPGSEPGLVAPVMLRSDDVLYPHRMVWPAFWGQMVNDTITPLNPDAAYEAVRKKLRVKRNSTFTETLAKVRLTAEDKAALLGEERAQVPASELTEEEKAKLSELEASKSVTAFREKVAEALDDLKTIISTEGAIPVYVAGGRAYRLAAASGAEEAKPATVEPFSNPAAEPYAWKLAHDVRPARWSSGATGCFDCHSPGSDLFDGQVTARGPAPDTEPPTGKMAELAGYDRTQIDAWNQSFQGRTAFKWLGFFSAGVVALILLSFLLLGINGLVGVVRRA